MTRTSDISRISIAVVVLLTVGTFVPFGALAQQGEGEPNDAQEAARAINGTSIDSEISQQGDTDWFSKKFSTGETASFAVTKSTRKNGLLMRLYAPNGTEINESTSYHGVGKMEISAPVNESGKYYVEIKAVDESDTDIPYTVYAPANEAPPKKQPQNPVAGKQEEIEPNNASQSNIIEGKELSGTISSKMIPIGTRFTQPKGKTFRCFSPNQTTLLISSIGFTNQIKNTFIHMIEWKNLIRGNS